MTSGLSPVQRTIRELKNQGRKCGIVQRWNAYVGPHGARQDLFGILDIIALDPERGVIGIQCTGIDFANHLRKLTEEKAQDSLDWLQTPGTSLELWAWRKVKRQRGGIARVWRPRIQEIKIEDIK